MRSQVHAQIGRCSQCGSLELVRDEEMGEIVCSNCGLVIQDDMLNQNPEWHSFTIEEENSKRRTGLPIRYSLFDKGLSTIIRVDRDAFGRPISAKTKRRMQRLRKWHNRSKIQASNHVNLMHATNELQRLSEKLNVPFSVKEMAAVLYRKTLHKKLCRGRSIKGMVAGALYAACRLTETPKTLIEIAETSLREKEEVARCYRLLIRTLEMKMPVHDPLRYMSKIADRTGISGETLGLAVEILQEAKKKRVISGKGPMGVAATVLYIASQLKEGKITQSELAQAANVTEVTIRNVRKELMRKLDICVRMKWLDQQKVKGALGRL